MSLGSWNPDADSAADQLSIEPATVARFIGYAREGQLESLEQLISGDESQILAGLMKLAPQQWLSTAETLEEGEVLDLLRFFAVAENLPGWEAGANSPVIPLAKNLRKRGVRLDRELLQWLRQVNDNRFLPYGPL